MSWPIEKIPLVTNLANLGYTEVPDILDIEQASESHNHKCYVLKYEGLQDTSITSNGFIGTRLVSLEINYLNYDSITRDNNANLFESLVSSLYLISGFANLISSPTFIDYRGYQTKGTIKFYFGYRGF